MRIGFVTARDARDPRSWSGTPYFMARALAGQGGQVAYIGPLAPPSLLVMKALNLVRRRLGLTGTLPKQSRRVARANARMIAGRLGQERPDILFSPAGSALVGLLETDLPVAYTSDATVRLMAEYYAEFSDLAPAALAEAETLEAAAIARADLLLYPTEWAARSAREHYGADPARIHVLPFGANLETVPERAAALGPRRGDGVLRLLFVGVSWTRKGGAIAAAARAALAARGITAELTVVGCVPPPEVPREGLRVIPFLDKNDPAQLRQLSDLYLAADLLLLPTRTECFGIVFCEAAAHGVPSIATATGGVPDVVREGITGHTLPPGADGAAYAGLIAGLVAEPGRLAALRASARADYEDRLNWEVWAARSTELFAAATAARPGRAGRDAGRDAG